MDTEELFPKLSPEQIACLEPIGQEVCLEPGETLFTEGGPEREFYVLVEGQLRIIKQAAGSETTLRVHEPGEFTGALSVFRDGVSIATGRAVGSCRLIRIDRDRFGQVLAACPDVAETVLFAMAERRPMAEAQTRQQEKLAALGKLSAGLAHELNNPAAAARRAAADLRETLARLPSLTMSVAMTGLSSEAHPCLLAFLAELSADDNKHIAEDALARSDREDALGDWLDAHHVSQGWELVPALAEAHLDTARLDTLAEHVGEAALPAVLAWLAAAAAADDLAHQVEHSAERISELVLAVKSYSYRDQAPQQEIDVHEGLESTLKIMGYKLRGIQIVREYDHSLPRLTAYGGELNQVWTNIIHNAADAMSGQGTLTLHTARENQDVLVEIIDSGPGIPEDVLPHIFDPFFTTKDVGEGTGLGLDTAHRIIVARHHGEIGAESRPGETRFQVRLPLTASGPNTSSS